MYPRLASISPTYCLGLPNSVIIHMNSMFILIMFHTTLVSQYQALSLSGDLLLLIVTVLFLQSLILPTVLDLAPPETPFFPFIIFSL